ncbi:MAG: CoA pyrophosphatase [Clostridiales Family XIII bacterium]|jgi:8-oxo-dGTP pyrophosphatase MutT (NUDIX family)|nr:CoA pyrophosphatase [Clostridiales Family XIII bacterium]
MEDKLTISDIAEGLRGHRPEPVGRYRFFSVLLPLVEKGGELCVLYEVRAEDMDVQPGEVSFPGGAIEAGETAQDAAVRETVEELCVPEGSVRVLQELNYLVTYSNFTLYCFLGTIDAAALAAATPSAAEVKETFLVPLSWLLAHEPETYVNRVVPKPAEDLPVRKLSKDGDYPWRTGKSTVMIYTWPDPGTGEERVIWGLTARLTQDFVRLLKQRKEEAI